VTPTTPSAPRDRGHGFTLLELLVVFGLISVLMGLGVGFLRRTDTNRSAALSAVGGEIRRAANTARSRGLPTDVVLDRGAEGMPASVWARVLAPVGAWHFEPGQRDVRGPAPDLNALIEPGRFGSAARFDPEGKGPLLRVAADGPRFDLRHGFALRMDLRLEARELMVLARMGQSLDVRLDTNLIPVVRMVQRGTGEQSGTSVTVRGTRPLPTEQWLRLEVVFDQTRLSVRVDGREVASTEADGELFQREDESFDVSPDDAPLVGVIDEIELLAYERSEPQLLPLEVELDASVTLRLDAQGDPVPPATFGWFLHGDDVRETFRVKAGGVIQ